MALRPRGSATRASAVPTWHIYYIYSYITYSIRGIQPPVYREGIRPLSPSGLINPTEFLITFRVGIIPHATYHAGDVARRGATDQMGNRSTRVDRMRPGPPTINQARAI